MDNSLDHAVENPVSVDTPILDDRMDVDEPKQEPTPKPLFKLKFAVPKPKPTPIPKPIFKLKVLKLKPPNANTTPVVVVPPLEQIKTEDTRESTIPKQSGEK